MVRVASLFSQLLRHIPRTEFEGLVRKHRAERDAKGFSCWTQLVAMLFSQLAHATSLRDICNGLACSLGKLVHLGVNRTPRRSTLAYANKHRPAALYEDLFWVMMRRFRSTGLLGARKAKFRFKNKLLSLDSTTITLCLSLFPWADFRRTKGGVKLHVLLDHDDYLPSYLLISKGKLADVKVASLIRLPPGSIIVEDRGYCDYGLFAKWNAEGVFFVTRLKSNTAYEVVRPFDTTTRQAILADDDIRFTEPKASKVYPGLLRRVVVWDSENECEIALLTNHRFFGPTTIAAIYKDRWEIELFFKALKQNLHVKTFVGTSENALRIQIWTALLALLILKWLHHISKAGWSLSNMAYMLRMSLFTYRDLQDWLDDPTETPPLIPEPTQLALPMRGLGQPALAPTG